MPPHCDSLDGPVVAAAREALATGDVDRALPYVPAHDEPEVREAFALAQTPQGWKVSSGDRDRVVVAVCPGGVFVVDGAGT